MFGEDFLWRFLERTDIVCTNLNNSLSALHIKLYDANFNDLLLSNLKERFIYPAFIETFYDHAVLLKEKSPQHNRILSSLLDKEIDTLHQNMEDGEKVLRNVDYFPTEEIASLKLSSPILYQECLEYVLQLTEKNIVSSLFVSIRSFLILAKLQEKLETNKDRTKSSLKLQTKQVDFDPLFYEIISAKHNLESESPELIGISAKDALKLYNLYQKAVIRSVKACLDKTRP